MELEKSYSQLIGNRPTWLKSVSDRTAHSLKVLHGFKSADQLIEWLKSNDIKKLKNLGHLGREEAYSLTITD